MANILDSNGENKPTPDPTFLTSAQIERAVKAERDYVDGRFDVLEERLNGIDRATEVLDKSMTDVPTDVQEKVGNLRDVMSERLKTVAIQFKERDVRAEREARDNRVAVDAAFAAQKEASAEQNKSNTLAITKSEVATADTITKLAESFKTSTQGLNDKIDDLKDRINKSDNTKIGQERTIGRIYAALGAAVAIVTLIAMLSNGVFGGK